MKIRIVTPDNVLHATLHDNPSARDFWAMLPLTLLLADYENTEKVSTLPRKLCTEQAPDGIVPRIGDLCHYAPWGNLALFYRDFDYSRGLIRLGHIEGSVEVLTQSPSFTVTIERD